MRRHKTMIFAALLATASPVMAQQAPLAGETSAQAGATSPARISVSGKGEVLAAPDMATISLGVTNTASSAKAAMDQTSAALAAVVENLKAAGVEARDLQTAGLSLQPDWANSSSGQNGIQGYTARNEVTVVVRALGGLGSILDAAVGDGANTLNGVTFGVADPAPLLDEARLRAVADARHRAEGLTGAAGVRLGPIISMAEQGSLSAGPRGGMMLRASSDAVPVEAGELRFSVTVDMAWQLVQ